MKAKVSLKMFVLSAALLIASFTASARNNDGQLIYNQRMTESEALKWDSNKDEWVKNLRINYIYEGKTVTTNYYKWNAKKRTYVLVPEMTVTMDNTNM